jgi:diacylglycerol kinase family enzyme
MRVSILHNPGAGDDDHSGDALREAVESAGHEVGYRSLRSTGWEEALAEPGDLLVVAGGDGSVGEVFREIAADTTPVTILPVGSANNIAASLGIDPEQPLERLVAGWATGEQRRFDVGLASTPWGERRFLEAIGGGMFAEVLVRAEGLEHAEGVDVEGDEKVELGLEVLREVVERLEPAIWRVVVDGVELEEELLGVEVVNIARIGPRLPLASADPGDGRLDVVLVRPDDRTALVSYLSQRLRDLDPEPPALESRRGRLVELEAPASVPLHVDDTRWPHESGADTARVQVRPERILYVLIPHLSGSAGTSAGKQEVVNHGRDDTI